MKKLMIDISNIKAMNRVMELKQHEENLKRELRDVRKEMKIVADSSHKKSRTGGALTHATALELVLTRAGGPMKLSELADEAVRVGAITRNKNSVSSFCRTMISRPDKFKNVGWGMWTLR